MTILRPDATTTLNGVKINEYLLTKHNPNHIDMPSASMAGKIIGVTVHNTDWISVIRHNSGGAIHSCHGKRQHERCACALLRGQHLCMAEFAAYALRLARCGRLRKWEPPNDCD